jgi:hypothetical protein
MFVWSPGLLTTVEQEYIGVIHKTADVTHPFAGVLIMSVSMDTAPGKGLIEYEYNAADATYRLRWTSFGTTWTPGSGWVNVLSDGVNTLQSPDSSFLEVYVTHDLLPRITGTPPSATISKEVSISDNTTNQGIVRDISPAHSSFDIIDVSEYAPDGLISNVRGPITEGDFIECDLVNMLVNDGALETFPQFKHAFLSPAVEPVEGESLIFSVASPYVAALQYESDQDLVETVLYQDGVVVPNNEWHYNSSNEIELAAGPSGVYTIDYRPIYQVTTPFLDLGTALQEYVWFADSMLWDRMEHNKLTREAEVPIFFSQDTGRASLRYPSTMSKDTATLFYDTTDDRVEVSKLNWFFLNPYEVRMEASQYESGVQYYLSHDEVRVYPQSGLDITLEHRSGVNTPSCYGGSWRTLSRNQNVNVNQVGGPHTIHQLRLSIKGARSLKDFRLRSLILKGLHIHGPNAITGGLTNV